MKKRKGKALSTPAQERRDIGTPAGESPEKGIERHETECLAETCPIGVVDSRKAIIDERAAYDFVDVEDEISPGGGIRAGKAHGGVPPGGKIEQDNENELEAEFAEAETK